MITRAVNKLHATQFVDHRLREVQYRDVVLMRRPVCRGHFAQYVAASQHDTVGKFQPYDRRVVRSPYIRTGIASEKQGLSRLYVDVFVLQYDMQRAIDQKKNMVRLV